MEEDSAEGESSRGQQTIKSRIIEGSTKAETVSNDDIFQDFQDNMALIAGYSFEILKLYEVIRGNYE